MSDDCCEHVRELRAELERRGIRIWSEHGEPDGWVNIGCATCHRTYELSLIAEDDSDE